jgi:enoyl-CoA hydratase/carnithine racemase
VFSAGADLEEAHAGLATAPVWEEVSGNLAALECLTIAALNGTLAGGAFGMALACDIRLAVPRAVLLPGGEARLPAAALGPRADAGADGTCAHEAPAARRAEIHGG